VICSVMINVNSIIIELQIFRVEHLHIFREFRCIGDTCNRMVIPEGMARTVCNISEWFRRVWHSNLCVLCYTLPLKSTENNAF
jgi:hypothetical protein